MSSQTLSRLPVRTLQRLYGCVQRGCDRAVQPDARALNLLATRGLKAYPLSRVNWLERHPWHSHENSHNLFRSLDGEFQKMRDLFESNFFSPRFRGVTGRNFAAADVHETEKAFHVKLDLPGLKKQDIKVQVSQDRTLSISGKRESVTSSEVSNSNGAHYSERSAGAFKREFQLPETADTANIVAKSEDGVLTVNIPKLELSDAGVSEINIA